MKRKHFVSITAFAVFLLTACKNDDVQPEPGTIGISIAQDVYGEDAGTVEVVFTAGSAFADDVSITYEITGTATSGEDYEAVSGSATLRAGETSLTQGLTLFDDDEVETDEQIIITITAVNGSQDLLGSNKELVLTITDNDSYTYENGALVLHEGNFGAGNASVSFVSDDLDQIWNGIFKSVNEVDNWGDTAQSIAFDGDLAYIVVNNSQKIEVVNRYSFKSIATIGGPDKSDFLNPRYMAIVNGKGYVTNWGDGSDPNDDFVAVIDLADNTVENPIPVGEGPEAIVAKENTIYVAHQGGFGQNNIVSVIDATSNTVVTALTVADRPNSLQLDDDGNLWVLSGGNPAWTGNETAGQLDRIDTDDNTVANTFTFNDTEHPGALSYDNGKLYYYLSGAVYKMGVSATALPQTAELTGLNFADMAINAGRLYGVDAKDFVSNGSLVVYDLDDNSLLATKEVSIIPTGVYFNGDFSP